MKAYKGFDRNMRCRGFQFAEGETYEEDKAELCETGFHACTNPLDVLRYYSPVDGCEYHEVELEDVSEGQSSKDSKVCGKRIRIGAKLGIEELVDASVRMSCEEAKGVKDAQGALTDNSAISTQIASSGDKTRIAASGHKAYIAASGNKARISASGYETRIETLGANCVMMCTGQNNRAKGKVGSWIVLTEWVNGEPNVVAKRIDGTSIKADTWYVLRDGQLQEVDTNE